MDLSLGLSESKIRAGKKEAEILPMMSVCVPDPSPVDLMKSRV